jgi:Rieske Fe-S protein
MEHGPDSPSTPVELLPGRRTFFGWLTYAAGAAAAVVFSIPFLGYVFGAWKKEENWFSLGPVSAFPLNETRLVDFDNPIRQPWDGMIARTRVFVRYLGKDEANQDRFLVLAVNCAHLGCPVSWFPQSGLFMCPCHGGVYYDTGDRASGPPPRGLYRFEPRVRDGQLEVQAPHYPTLQDPLVPGDTGISPPGTSEKRLGGGEKRRPE